MAVDLSVDRLVEEIRNLRNDFSKMSDVLVKDVRRQTGEAAARVRNAAEDTWDDAMDGAAGVARRIEDQPLAATAIAFGVGILLGMLLLGRRR